MTRVLLNTWRRRGRVLGPVLRDMHGAEVAYPHVLQDAGATPYLVPRPGVGVQWHPELMPDDPAQRALVAGFVGTCRARRGQRCPGYSRRPLSPTTGRAS